MTRTRSILTGFLVLVASSTTVWAQDPLPSWNDGAAKKAIVEFVQATTAQGSPKFVPPEERIATFDQDGTLWVEHPIYSQIDLLPRSRSRGRQGEAGARQRRAVQDRDVGRPGGHRQALRGGPRSRSPSRR